MKQLVPSPATLSLGGAYLRLWDQEQGLVAEIPTAVVQDRRDGSVVYYGEEAQSMHGKLPDHLQYVRPFFRDRIIDRDLLRGLLQILLREAGQSLPWQQELLRGWRCQLALPPSMLEVHRHWLQKTLREAGFWFVRVADPYAAIVSTVAPKAKTTLVSGVLDVGFTQQRLAVYVGQDLVLAREYPLGLRDFCHHITKEEVKHAHIQFSPSVLYSQQWFTQHIGFNTREKIPVQVAVQKATVKRVARAFSQETAQWMQSALSELASPVQANLQQHGFQVVGGGSDLPELLADLNELLPVPFTKHRHALYAHLRMGQ